ncbi:DMT family transporter [Saccharospirillum impatiens]|uniref:DMT family transporter n=1 Tax=Saccharospirillum impatiens TaxID=169438 RepID=UPI000409B82C|nr:DMT family transporter [Saccharospirillum impatiens]
MASYTAHGLWLKATPVLFVLLWSTGFIGAKFGLPYAEPYTFLFVRFIGVLAVLFVLIQFLNERWPKAPMLWLHIGIVGMLVHGLYLGAVFTAISLDMPAGVTALIVGLQPLVTAILARFWLGETINRQQWLGILLGLVGIALVLSEQLDMNNPTHLFAGFGWIAVASAFSALLGISVGTLYQKRYCTGMPLVTGTFIQYLGASLILGLGAWLFETRTINWTPTFTLALLWLIFGLSIAAILLLMTLIRRGAASRVASLFYLVPPVVAIEAWVLFDEQLGPLALVGIAVAVVGVALAVKKPTQ